MGTRNENKIESLIDRIANLNIVFNYIDEQEDSVIDIELFYWFIDNEKLYNEFLKFVDSSTKTINKHKISLCYDVSNFDYWKRNEEENYLVCTIHLNDNLSTDDIDDIVNCVEYIADKVFYEYHKLLEL